MKLCFKVILLFSTTVLFSEPFEDFFIWPQDAPNEKKGEVGPE
jgi:hypothetical protein